MSSDEEDSRNRVKERQGWARATTGTSNRVLKIVSEMGYNTVSGDSAAFSSATAKAIQDARDKEKKMMQDLNDKFASYIEKVRFLEAQNRKLSDDLADLKGKWGQENSGIRKKYEKEVNAVRKQLDDTAKNKTQTEAEINKIQDNLNEMTRKYKDAKNQAGINKDRVENLMTQLSDAEAEIGLLRRRIEQQDDDLSRIKKENKRLKSDLDKAKNDLDEETLSRIDFQNQVQTLMEEIEFLKDVQEQEMKDMEALLNKDNSTKSREYFKNELALAIRDIRNEYDNVATQNRSEMESWYKMKVQEVKSASIRQTLDGNHKADEVNRLRTQVSQLRGKLSDVDDKNAGLERQLKDAHTKMNDDQMQYEADIESRDGTIRKMKAECQTLMSELQALFNTKQTLDAEIAIYRKMLEGETNHKGLKQIVEDGMNSAGFGFGSGTGGGGGGGSGGGGGMSSASGGTSYSPRGGGGDSTSYSEKRESTKRVSYQRSAKGNVGIVETDMHGRFITLENSSRFKDETLGQWTLRRKLLDSKKEVTYVFPDEFVLGHGKTTKIWAGKGGGTSSPPDEIIFEGEESWGIGNNIQTILADKNGEEKATYIQRTAN